MAHPPLRASAALTLGGGGFLPHLYSTHIQLSRPEYGKATPRSSSYWKIIQHVFLRETESLKKKKKAKILKNKEMTIS